MVGIAPVHHRFNSPGNLGATGVAEVVLWSGELELLEQYHDADGRAEEGESGEH
jgi:hypothetical protein